MDKLIGKKIFGKYTISKLLGNGTFGYVFKGKNIINGENVTLKIEEWKKKRKYIRRRGINVISIKRSWCS